MIVLAAGERVHVGKVLHLLALAQTITASHHTLCVVARDLAALHVSQQGTSCRAISAIDTWVRRRLARGVESGGRDRAIMSHGLAERLAGASERLAGAGVPDARCVIRGRGDDAIARGVENGGRDRAIMSHGLAERLAGAGVPDARCVIRGRGDDAIARGVENGGLDNCIVDERWNKQPIRGQRAM